MKYVIIGDIHGRSLEKLSETVEDFEDSTLLCTGDFDFPEQVRQFQELTEKQEWTDVITVPGNHDDSVFNNLTIRSETLRKNEVTIERLHVDLMRDTEATKFMGKILDSNIQEIEIGDYSTVLIHGGFNGSLSSFPDCPPEKTGFWYRILNKEDYRKNFEQMKERGYDLMIRGHDHNPEFAYLNSENQVEIEKPSDGDSYSLDKEMATITHGAWYDGWHTVIENEEEMKVTFHQV